jgi:hypothetical protein
LLRPNTLPRIPEEHELARAADELSFVGPLRGLPHVQEPVGGDRFALSLQRDRLDVFHLNGAPDERKRRCAEQDLAGLRRLLEPSGDVDGVAGRQPLLGAGNHLAGVDADASLYVELGERGAHLRRRTQRSQRIVLMRYRYAEHRHHSVADELLHCAAVPLDNRAHPLEIAGEETAQRLRVDGLTKRGRARDVAEEDGDGLPLHNRRLERRPGYNNLGCARITV